MVLPNCTLVPGRDVYRRNSVVQGTQVGTVVVSSNGPRVKPQTNPTIVLVQGARRFGGDVDARHLIIQIAQLAVQIVVPRVHRDDGSGATAVLPNTHSVSFLRPNSRDSVVERPKVQIVPGAVIRLRHTGAVVLPHLSYGVAILYLVVLHGVRDAVSRERGPPQREREERQSPQQNCRQTSMNRHAPSFFLTVSRARRAEALRWTTHLCDHS